MVNFMRITGQFDVSDQFETFNKADLAHHFKPLFDQNPMKVILKTLRVFHKQYKGPPPQGANTLYTMNNKADSDTLDVPILKNLNHIQFIIG